MSNYEFSPLYVTRLSVEASYSLNETTLSYATPHASELGGVCEKSLDQMETITTQLGQSINKTQKSALTPEIKLIDKDRDAVSYELFRITGTFIRSTDPPLRTAAATMQLFLTPYKGLPERPLDMQTRLTSALLRKYNSSDELKAAAQVLGIDKFFASLAELNSAFADKYEIRQTEHATKEVAGSTIKSSANTAFVQFCTALEQAANFTPNNTILALFNKMDELRKIYHAREGGKSDKPTADDSTK